MSEFKVEFKGCNEDYLLFKVFINNHWFDYSQGIGHIIKDFKNVREILNLDEHDMIVKVRTSSTSCLNNLSDKNQYYIRKKFDRNLYRCNLITIVKRKDVEHCLYLDAKYGETSFKDFCDDLGLSDDSFKAFDSYKACMETNHKMRGYKYFEGVEEY